MEGKIDMSNWAPGWLSWSERCRQLGLNLDCLDAEEMFNAHQRLNALLLSLDDVVDGASDTAAVFKPEEYVS